MDLLQQLLSSTEFWNTSQEVNVKATRLLEGGLSHRICIGSTASATPFYRAVCHKQITEMLKPQSNKEMLKPHWMCIKEMLELLGARQFFW